jgi:hypothetical protein
MVFGLKQHVAFPSGPSLDSFRLADHPEQSDEKRVSRIILRYTEIPLYGIYAGL